MVTPFLLIYSEYIILCSFVYKELTYHYSINVNWRKFERDYHHVFDRDGDGKVTTNDFKQCKIIVHCCYRDEYSV